MGPQARYCLACGARQPGARIDLLEHVPGLDGGSAVAVAAPTSAPAIGRPSTPAADEGVGAAPAGPATVLGPTPRSSWPFAATAVALTALVVGLLGGHLVAQGRTPSAAPAATPSAAAPAAATGDPAAAPAGATGAAPATGAPTTATAGAAAAAGAPTTASTGAAATGAAPATSAPATSAPDPAAAPAAPAAP